MAEYNDVNWWGIAIEGMKSLVVALLSIIGFLVLAIAGIKKSDIKQYLKEHKDMLAYFNDKTGDSAGRLKVKKDQDWEDVIAMLKELKKQNVDIQHDVNGGRQDTKNLYIMLKAKGVIE